MFLVMNLIVLGLAIISNILPEIGIIERVGKLEFCSFQDRVFFKLTL